MKKVLNYAALAGLVAAVAVLVGTTILLALEFTQGPAPRCQREADYSMYFVHGVMVNGVSLPPLTEAPQIDPQSAVEDAAEIDAVWSVENFTCGLEAAYGHEFNPRQRAWVREILAPAMRAVVRTKHFECCVRGLDSQQAEEVIDAFARNMAQRNWARIGQHLRAME